ncbi:MAG: GNAT family N-acetyltransferase [Parasphingopyxis sp.]|uniref:GNAT family N-acetyltransferase n=1 Tax=Parasphingopyxis sp. TaxID=1920299 RepID=UPI0032EE6CEF
MFAVTKRLLLRPGWVEDAPELAAAIGHKAVVRNLARAPWPYRLEDAEGFLASDRDARFPNFQIVDRKSDPVRMIGGVGFQPDENGDVEFGYWIEPGSWGKGYATEAGRAALDAARSWLGYGRIVAGHFIDNPASGKVLRKLGFRPTGRIVPRYSRARGEEAECILFAQDPDDSAMPSADQPALAA